MSEKPLDPHLAALIEKYPQFEIPFFNFLLENKHNAFLQNFSNTPTWALMEDFRSASQNYMKTSIVSHPNFDPKELENIASGSDTILMSGATHNPNISKRQLQKISQCGDETVTAWANYYLQRNTPEFDIFIESELQLPENERTFTLRTALREEKLSDQIIQKVIRHADENVSRYSGEKIGAVLALNPHLADEFRANLHLLGFSKVEDQIDYPFYPSSQYIVKKSEVTRSFDDEITQALFTLGHPLGMVTKQSPSGSKSYSEEDLSQLIESEFLHRMFWRELFEEIEDFRLNFHNGYQVQDLFVNHPIISEKFDNADFEEAWREGGVLPGHGDRLWVTKDSYISEDRIESLLTSYAEDLEEITQDCETFADAQPRVLAYLKFVAAGQELCAEFEIELTEKADEEIDSGATDYAEPGDYDVDVEINFEFNEFISWINLPETHKEVISNFLIFGSNCISERLQRDSEHFLACMALHPATPSVLTEELQKLESEIIQSTLTLKNGS